MRVLGQAQPAVRAHHCMAAPDNRQTRSTMQKHRTNAMAQTSCWRFELMLTRLPILVVILKRCGLELVSHVPLEAQVSAELLRLFARSRDGISC